MATESTDCSSRGRTSTAAEGDHIDKDLQNIFKKLRVNNKPKKGALHRRIKCTKTKPKNSRKSSHKPWKIIQDPMFIFTSTETNDLENKDMKSELKNDKAIWSSKVTELPLVSGAAATNNMASRVQGCGAQFRNEANIKMADSLDMDDTTPGELAAYFDQLLHIPKPMSQMAEMMYT